MSLSSTQKKIVIDALKDEYIKTINSDIFISDRLDLQMREKIFQVCLAENEIVKILFVLFDAEDQTSKVTQVKQLCSIFKYNIGHSVHYQFHNEYDEQYLGIILSKEIF